MNGQYFLLGLSVGMVISALDWYFFNYYYTNKVYEFIRVIINKK